MIPSVIIVLCLIYVLFVRRQGDFFTLAIFSSSLYFMPVIFGYTWYIQDKRDVFHEITPEMNIFYAIFLTVLLIAVCINDLALNKRKKIILLKINHFHIFIIFQFLFSLCGYFLMLMTF